MLDLKPGTPRPEAPADLLGSGCDRAGSAIRDPAELLAEIERSDLFSPGYPRRPRRAHADAGAMTLEEKRASLGPSLEALRRTPDVQTLVGLVRALGRARYASAVPTLAKLWVDCALVPVRAAAGHALRAIGTEEALSTLQALIEDADHLSVYLGVLSIFDQEPPAAFKRLAAYFMPERVRSPGGAAIPTQVLAIFAPSAFSGPEAAPRWSEERAPEWLRGDLRWVELCCRLRQDEVLGRIAREVLRHAEPRLVRRVLGAVRAREPRSRLRSRLPPRNSAPSDLLARYRRGEHEAVWKEIRSQGAIALPQREEVCAVARETMQRVAHGADWMADRLRRRGWLVLGGALRTACSDQDNGIMDRIESSTGAPLPPALSAFWEIAGGIDFVWNYNQGEPLALIPGLGLGIDDLDPLCVGPAIWTQGALEEWEQERPEDPELRDPLALPLAPDALHKADISGGPPYSVEVPFAGADPLVANEPHRLPFVDYLRLCFAWGGFPGLERVGERPDVREFVNEMTRECEPF